MKSFKRTATISKRSPGILLRVPRRCTNGSEEVFRRRFIAIEQLVVEVTWVPIDYHTPKIEDCGTIFCHCKYILSFLGKSSIMSVSRTTLPEPDCGRVADDSPRIDGLAPDRHISPCGGLTNQVALVINGPPLSREGVLTVAQVMARLGCPA